MSILSSLLQEPFLRATEVHYAAEGQHYMATTNVAEYLQHCEARSRPVLQPHKSLNPAWSSQAAYGCFTQLPCPSHQKLQMVGSG